MRRLAVLLALDRRRRVRRRRRSRPRRATSSPRCGRGSPRRGARRPGGRRGGGRRSRAGLRPRADRVPRPLRAGRGAASAPRPEPRARPRVRFAEFRNGIRDGAPMSRDPRRAREIRAASRRRPDARRQGLRCAAARVRLLVHDPLPRGRRGRAAARDPARRAQAGRASDYRRPLAAGVLAAIAATSLTWVLATLVLEIAPVQRELLEGVTAVARGRRPLHRSASGSSPGSSTSTGWSSCARGSPSAIAAGSALAFAGLGFTAVYREGFETVLFYQALVMFAEGLGLWVALGVAAAAGALGVVGYAILKLGRRLPVKPMLTVGAVDRCSCSRSRSPATPSARCRAPTGSASRRSTATGRGCRSSSPS